MDDAIGRQLLVLADLCLVVLVFDCLLGRFVRCPSGVLPPWEGGGRVSSVLTEETANAVRRFGFRFPLPVRVPASGYRSDSGSGPAFVPAPVSGLSVSRVAFRLWSPSPVSVQKAAVSVAAMLC